MDACIKTLDLVGTVLPVLFLSLVGVEVLTRMGVMDKIEPLGRPLAKLAHLPSQAAITFVASAGSLIAANTLLVRYHHDGSITGRELVLGAVFNTVPLHFKETLTYHLPVVLPLLGFRLFLVYVAVFWLSGVLKLAVVIVWGRRSPRVSAAIPGIVSGATSRGRRPGQSLVRLLGQACRVRGAMALRMGGVIVAVTFVVQMLVVSGAMHSLERLVGPLVKGVGLPPAVAAPLSVYIFSPLAGLTSMSALLRLDLVSEYHAAVGLLAAGFLMVPITRLRGTMPRYVSILGMRHGMQALGIGTALSLVSRAFVLLCVLVFW